MTKLEYMPWPHAVQSHGFYPPEVAVQVPMSVFRRTVEEVSDKTKVPEWTEDALASGEPFLLMKGRTFYGLVKDVPDWMVEYVESDRFEEELENWRK